MRHPTKATRQAKTKRAARLNLAGRPKPVRPPVRRRPPRPAPVARRVAPIPEVAIPTDLIAPDAVLLSQHQAARLLATTPGTVREWKRSGVLREGVHVVYHGRRPKYLRAALLDLAMSGPALPVRPKRATEGEASALAGTSPPARPFRAKDRETAR